MTLNQIIDGFSGWIDRITHSSWFGTAITIVIIAVTCAVLARVTTVALRKLLKSDKGPLPSVSLFVNIARVTIWVFGLCIVLSSCFDVNIGAAITALGIGGIAISLGFQSTLSNLIGGIQIIIIGLIEPGDRIQVNGYEGVVRDVTWRHTKIITARNEQVIIPNSVINSDALVKMPPETDIKIDIHLKPEDGQEVSALIKSMETAVEQAISKDTMLVKKPKINLVGMDHLGYKGLLTFVVAKGKKKSEVIDVAMKAINQTTNATSSDTSAESRKTEATSSETNATSKMT